MPKRYREYRLPLLLAALCAVLLGVLLLEWLYLHHLETGLNERLAAKIEARTPQAEGEPEKFELPSLDSYTRTLEQPLFMETRKPADVDAVEPNQPEIIRAPLSFKLMGVALTPDNLAVGLFVDARGKYKRLHKGDATDGWTVAELLPDKAIMEQSGNREVLLLFKPKPKRPAQPQAPNGQPPPPGQMPGQMPGQPPDNPMPQDGVDAETSPPNEPVDETYPPVSPDEMPEQ